MRNMTRSEASELCSLRSVVVVVAPKKDSVDIGSTITVHLTLTYATIMYVNLKYFYFIYFYFL